MKNTMIVLFVLIPTTMAWADHPRVVLFGENGFHGRQEVLSGDDANLRNNHIGNDNLNSIVVPHGVVVTLYEHKNFRGRSLVLDRDVANLNRTSFGNNCASSIRIERKYKGRVGHHGRDREYSGNRDYPRNRDNPSASYHTAEGITLFRGDYYEGKAQRFYYDTPDLRGTHIGNDSVNSLLVPPGYRVTLYEHTHYRGRSETFTCDDPLLANNHMGNNRASSLRIQRDEPSRPARRSARGVTLYQRKHFSGRSQVVTDRISNLKGSHIGNDQLSSIRVPPGCRVVLYTGKNFTGRSEVLTESDPNLNDNWVGNNRVSSLRVEYRTRR